MPPVAAWWMPHSRAIAMVPATVVAPSAPSASVAARSRGDTLRGCSRAIRSRSSRRSPTRISPSISAMVAGIAPAARTASSDATAVSTPVGCGKPCETYVVSSATTGWPRTSASRTSRAMFTYGAG